MFLCSVRPRTHTIHRPRYFRKTHRKIANYVHSKKAEEKYKKKKKKKQENVIKETQKRLMTSFDIFIIYVCFLIGAYTRRTADRNANACFVHVIFGG